VPGITFRYFNARNRRRAFDFLMKEFSMSGITRAELAIRTGKSRALISRLLGQPGNMTLDTMEELLFGISGKEVRYAAESPSVRQAKAVPTTQETPKPNNPIWLPTEEHTNADIISIHCIIGTHEGTTGPVPFQKIDALAA
jgi:hypothetical protein